MKRVIRWRRWWYCLGTISSYADRLNRSSEVESVLLAVATGKRGPLTPDECRTLAYKLGVPAR